MRLLTVALAALVLIAASAFAQEGKPVVATLDPNDAANPLLCQSLITPREDPTLGERQRRIIVTTAPQWYADSVTGELKAVVVDAAVKTDAEKSEQGYAVDTNTIQFLATEKGDSVYVVGDHKLRVWLVGQTGDLVTEGAPSARDVAAERPDALTKESANKLTMTGVLPDTTIEHVIEPGRVKEYIVIAYAPDIADAKEVRYTWAWESDLTPRVESNRIYWEHDGNFVLMFSAPLVWDAKAVRLAARYEIDRGQFSIVLDAAEMKAAAYPVVIDPTATATASAYIATKYTAGNPDDNVRWFFKLDLPDIGAGSTFDSADWKAYCTGDGASSYAIEVRSASNATWTIASSFATMDAITTFNSGVYITFNGTKSAWQTWTNIGGTTANSNTIAKAYDGETNPSDWTVVMYNSSGVAIHGNVDLFFSEDNEDQYVDFDNVGTANQPYLIVNYTEGEEPPAEVGDAMGSGSVGILGL